MPCHVNCSCRTVSQLRLYAQQLLSLSDHYKELVDSYVVEFFVKNRWDLIPASWQKALGDLTPEDIAHFLLDNDSPKEYPSVWPLSLLSYRAAVQALALDPTPMEGGGVSIAKDPTFKPIDLLCRLHVKAKKRHEILRMAEVISSASELTGTQRVVDVGSGQGHLSRLLSFGCGLDVTSIEAVGCHLTGAAKVDTKIKTIMQKRISKETGDNRLSHRPPQHVECTVHPAITVDEFLGVINNQSNHRDNSQGQSNNEDKGSAACTSEGPLTEISKSQSYITGKERISVTQMPQKRMSRDIAEEDEVNIKHKRGISSPNLCKEIDSSKSEGNTPISSSFVLAGLHTCGDLAPTMLRVFSKCPQAKALTSVACCYMKMECAIPPPLKTSSSITDLNVEQYLDQNVRQQSSVLQAAASECQTDGQEFRTNVQYDENDDCKNNLGGLGNGIGPNERRGYPMSQWVTSLGGKDILFEGLELACHSLPSYQQRLKDGDPTLVLHGYRATLEMLIQQSDRAMTQSHSGVCKIKKAVARSRKPPLKSFQEYARAALTELNIPFEERHLEEIEAKCGPRWNHVITFHVLRSMMAPIIESLVLVDRVLFLHEQGINSKLVPVFDASLSPRNFALVAMKNEEL